MEFRCNCPITSALDLIGDKWSLVIIKQMLVEGKKTFKEFNSSSESIATNILSSRLKTLEQFNMVVKQKLPNNNKTNIYLLTDKAISLAPTIIELALWSDKNLRDDHKTMWSSEAMKSIIENKVNYIDKLISNYKNNKEAMKINKLNNLT